MTIDERLERLTERHEALTQSLELLHHDIGEMQAAAAERDAREAERDAKYNERFSRSSTSSRPWLPRPRTTSAASNTWKADCAPHAVPGGDQFCPTATPRADGRPSWRQPLDFLRFEQGQSVLRYAREWRPVPQAKL